MTGDRRAVLTLPDETTIRVIREFAAPIDRVWRAWTDPDLVRRWWHAGRGTMTACEIDLRVGGRWRYAMTTPMGVEVGFHGEFREIEPGRRLVTTEIYEGGRGDVSLTSAAFATRDAVTVVSILVTAPTRDARDAIIRSGMEDGLQDALDLLEAAATEAARAR